MSGNNAVSQYSQGVNRRSGNDRRNRSLRTFLYSLHGRRRPGRRPEDSVNVYVDHHEPRYLAVVLGILVLSCADAVFTLNLIGAGIANEANPVMRMAMEKGIHFFILCKLVLTTFGLVVLLAHKNFHIFSRFKGSHILYAILIGYAVLIKYELWLFTL